MIVVCPDCGLRFDSLNGLLRHSITCPQRRVRVWPHVRRVFL